MAGSRETVVLVHLSDLDSSKVPHLNCYQGFRVKGETEGVGRATIAAFVESSVTVLVVDLFLTRPTLRVQFVTCSALL